MKWFSVRYLYQHGNGSDGVSTYEERTLLFHSETVDEAFEMADAASAEYLELNPTFRRIGEASAYIVGRKGDDLQGAEVWSVLGSSRLAPDEFVRQHYSAVEFQPEDSEPEGK